MKTQFNKIVDRYSIKFDTRKEYHVKLRSFLYMYLHDRCLKDYKSLHEWELAISKLANRDRVTIKHAMNKFNNYFYSEIDYNREYQRFQLEMDIILKPRNLEELKIKEKALSLQFTRIYKQIINLKKEINEKSIL